MCVHSFPLKPCECFTQSLNSFLADSHLETLLLCFTYSYFPSDCSGLYGFLCILFICVFSSSVSMAFYIFFSQTCLSSNKTCANHICLCFWWWHAPMFLWKLVLFSQKVKTTYSDVEEHCLWQLSVMFYLTAIL